MAKNNDKNYHKDWVANFRKEQALGIARSKDLSFPDVWVIVCFIILICIGALMVTSSSITKGSEPFYYINRQAFFYALGLFAAYIAFSIPTKVYEDYAKRLLIFAIFLMVLLNFTALGITVNGSRRWINLYFYKFQVTEIIKIIVIIYVARYLKSVKRIISKSYKPIIKIIVSLAPLIFLILRQPDYGTAVIILLCLFGMLFMAGSKLSHFIYSFLFIAIIFALVAVLEPYRVARFLSFSKSWEYPNTIGYQLNNSQIAIGRGGWFGVGLGNSVQKYKFLPEAHTDFIFSIIVEELGLLSGFLVVAIFLILLWRAFIIGKAAEELQRNFSASIAYGIGLLIFLQAIISIGVAGGSLPTKGLTLPFISYGGSSVVSMSVAIAILLRVDSESRYQQHKTNANIKNFDQS